MVGERGQNVVNAHTNPNCFETRKNLTYVSGYMSISCVLVFDRIDQWCVRLFHSHIKAYIREHSSIVFYI